MALKAFSPKPGPVGIVRREDQGSFRRATTATLRRAMLHPMNSANAYWLLGERGTLRVRRWLSFMRVRPAI